MYIELIQKNVNKKSCYCQVLLCIIVSNRGRTKQTGIYLDSQSNVPLQETRSRAVWRLHKTHLYRLCTGVSSRVHISVHNPPKSHLQAVHSDPVQSFVETAHNTSHTNLLSMDICVQLKQLLFLIPLGFYLTDATILHQHYTRVENGQTLAGSVGSEWKTRSPIQCSARYVDPVT